MSARAARRRNNGFVTAVSDWWADTFKKIDKVKSTGLFRFVDEDNDVIEDALLDNPATIAANFYQAVGDTQFEKDADMIDNGHTHVIIIIIVISMFLIKIMI